MSNPNLEIKSQNVVDIYDLPSWMFLDACSGDTEEKAIGTAVNQLFMKILGNYSAPILTQGSNF